MTRIDIREFISGVALIAIGLFVALYAANNYRVGTLARMGAGFFPTALGWTLSGLGIVIVLLSLRRRNHILTPPPFAIRPLLAVIVAVAVFSVLVERTGLIPATLISTVIVSMADSGFTIRRALWLGASLSVLSWLVFKVGLQMPLPAFVLWG